MLLVLIGWAVLLGSPAALVLSGVFVVYLDRFQIGPEERALTAIFGQGFLDYRARVRRWL
jgi:protein-S-isoprenylcysteine O-methyltransferase Ste14